LALLRNIEMILKEKMRTSVFIAHRLRTISNSGKSVAVRSLIGDKIIVLDHGTVVDSGSHADLVNSDGRYSKMWREQRAAEVNE